jgi:hypothetical protein
MLRTHQESLATEHGAELLANTFEEFLNRSGIPNESRRHFQSPGRNAASSSKNVVGDPLDDFISRIKCERTIARVLSLNTPHLFLDFLHADFSSEDGGDGQIPSLSRVGSSHHVLCVKHLLGQFRDTQGAERVTSTRRKGSESDHEKVQTGKGDHVDCEFSEIRVQLSGESETCGHAGHDCRDEVVKISVGRCIEFEGTDTDVIQGLIVDTEGLIRVFDELLNISIVYMGYTWTERVAL